MKGNEKLPAGQPGGRPLPGEGAFGLPAGHPGCRVPGVSTPGAGYANHDSVGRNPGAALITRGFPGVEGPRGFPRGLPGRVC